MDDGSRRVYRGIGFAFLGIGAAVFVLGAVQALLGLEIFRGRPYGVALFVGLVGGTLLWTVRRRD